MENIWDYIMRRKPTFLGYFTLFLASIFISCQFLDHTFSQHTTAELHTTQDASSSEVELLDNQNTPLDTSLDETDELHTYVLSPESVANLAPPEDNLLRIDIVAQNSDAASQHNITAQTSDSAGPSDIDIPLTGAATPTSDATSQPRRVSIFRTILAVLLAVAALTLAGLGLYQAYSYFAPFIDDFLQNQ